MTKPLDTLSDDELRALIPDALIAETSLDYKVTLYTKNVRLFLMIPGLTVVRPS